MTAYCVMVTERAGTQCVKLDYISISSISSSNDLIQHINLFYHFDFMSSYDS